MTRFLDVIIAVISLTAIFLALAAVPADASQDRHKPKPRPHVEKNIAKGGSAKSASDSGGNTLSSSGDDVDVAPTVSFSEDYPDLLPMIGDGCTVTDMYIYKAFLFGYAESVGTMTPECKLSVLPAYAGMWLATPKPGSAPCKTVSMPWGPVTKCWSEEQQWEAHFGVASLCEDYENVMHGMNINCD